jgi:fatty-acyl-CoA synthase
MYHSGDLAYRDESGFAYFAGRHGDWMRVDGENLGTAPIERILMRYPGVTEVAVYPIPDPAVGDQVMAALVLPDGSTFDPHRFREFLSGQRDLGPKQWPAYVRVGTALPRTETFKVLKRQLTAEATDCADLVHTIDRPGRRAPA